MRDDEANAETERDRSADAPRPQRVETVAVIGEVPSPNSQPHAADGGPSAVRAERGRSASAALSQPTDTVTTDTVPSRLASAADGGPAAVRRRWKRILIAFCAAVALLFALPRLLDRQPRYQGRTVEAWLDQMKYSKSAPNDIDPLTALRAMGRDAVPYEIRVLGRHDSMWIRVIRGLKAKAPTFVAGMLPGSQEPSLMRECAQLALQSNPHTAEFGPQIVRLLDDPDTHVRACALGVVYNVPECLDRSATRAICRALKEPDSYNRALAARTLGLMGTMAQEALPDLETVLEDTDFLVRLWAADALFRIRGTNFADGPLKQRMTQILLEAAQSGPTHVTNR